MQPRLRPSQSHPVENFVDQLVHPPTLHNPLRRPASVRKPKAEPDPAVLARPSPMKPRPRSEDKPSSLFSSSKIYTDPQSSETEGMMRASELELPVNKGVRFRDNLLCKNEHYRREQQPQEARTPSILKRSQLLRQKTILRLQSSGSQLSTVERPALQNEDREARATRTNDVVLRRFRTIVDRFEAKLGHKVRQGTALRSDEKYRDELFPPILSSVYRGGQSRGPGGARGVRWMRLGDLFRGRAVTLLPRGRSCCQVYCNQWRECGNFMGDALTAIKDCRWLLERIFGQNQVNPFGVYLVKIFQENVWKYVIVDDLVPTTRDEEDQPVPLFLTLSQNDPDAPLELWPFLLEKAYANYYANYESLHFGNTLDFLEEVTGCPAEEFKYLPQPQRMAQAMTRLSSYLERDNAVLLGKVDQTEAFVPIYRNSKGRLVAKRSYEPESSEVGVSADSLFEYFDVVLVLLPSRWVHSAVSTVGLSSRKAGSEVPRFDISLRLLRVSQRGLVSISVRQKERRFYQTSSLNYHYFWNRLLVLQKEVDGDCRWIKGLYSDTKTLSFTDWLEPGDYYLVLLPEWKLSQCYEVSVVVLGTVGVGLSRRDYDDRERLVEKGCADLAQREGRLQQISMYACSYCCVEEDVGLMVENINNERFNGDIRINRSIGTMRSLSAIVPFNLEFYLQKNNKAPFKTNISIYIPSDQAYTVVLLTRGGVDRALLKRFDFAK